MQTVFIVGVFRSGTTLLRVLLDSHPRVTAPPETPWVLGGGTLKTSVAQLVDELVDHPHGPVATLPDVGATRVVDAARDFVMALVNANGTTARPGDALVLKNPNDITNLEALGRLFPGARFLHIHRDGRDVACSAAAVDRWKGLQKGNVDVAMERWATQERSAHDWFESNPELAVHTLTYEDLVSEPEATMRAVCAFLDLEFDPTILDYARHEHVYPAWEVGSQDVKDAAQIHSSSVRRWRTDLSESRLLEFDRRYGDVLVRLGYPTAKAELGLSDRFRISHRVAAAIRHRSAGRSRPARLARRVRRVVIARRGARSRSPETPRTARTRS